MPTCIQEIPIERVVLRETVPLQIRSVIEERNNIQYNKNNSRNTEKLQILWTRKRGDLEELHNY